MESNELFDQRKLLLEEALMRMMIKTPYSQITVNDLVAEVGISRKTFYRTFPSKDDCLEEMMEQFVLNLHRSVTLKISQPVDLIASYSESLRYWQKYKAFFEALARDSLFYLIMKYQIIHIQKEEQALAQIMDAPEMQHDEDVLLFFAAGNATLCFNWLLGGCKTPIEEMARKLARLNHTPLLHQKDS